jgi:nitrite reductase/ring-hydroxylating ferredoxin subunit
MIVVLAPDVPRSTLDRLGAELATRGWQVEVSRGKEQTLLLVAGPAQPDELRGLLTGLEADILPVLEPEQYRRQYQRRRFLSAAITGLAVIVLTCLALPVWAFLQPPDSAVVAPDLVHVRGARDMAVGSALLLRIHDVSIHVVRVAPQRWHAVSGACTYSERCLLEWSVEQQRLLCACHGCAYDTYGNVLQPPASIPLVGFKVLESGLELYVRRTL